MSPAFYSLTFNLALHVIQHPHMFAQVAVVLPQIEQEENQ
jgi:hypothetical protein